MAKNRQDKPKKASVFKTLKSLPYEKTKFKWKKALLLFGIGALLYAVLKVFLLMDLRIFFVIYEILAGIPIIAYVIVVRGRLSKTPLPEELPDDWSPAEKQAFIDEENALKQKGRPFLYVALPLIIAVMMAFVSEYFIPIYIQPYFQ